MHQVGAHGDVDGFHGEGAFRAVDSSKAAGAGQWRKDEHYGSIQGSFVPLPPPLRVTPEPCKEECAFDLVPPLGMEAPA